MTSLPLLPTYPSIVQSMTKPSHPRTRIVKVVATSSSVVAKSYTIVPMSVTSQFNGLLPLPKNAASIPNVHLMYP